jgi:hypothetical protein
MVFGIAHGKVVGTAHNIMTEGGVSTGVCQDGMVEYTQVGERIIEPICGEDTLGLIVTYLTINFDRTGEDGTRMATGETIEIGVLQVCTIMVEQKVEQELKEERQELNSILKVRLQELNIKVQQ